MDDIEKAIKKLLEFESSQYEYFESDSKKKKFYDTIEEVKPILLKNQETKDEALKITYTLFKKNFLGINIIGFLLKQQANPNMIIDNEPIINLFLLDEELLKLFISSGFDINQNTFSNNNTLLMEIIKKYNYSFVTSHTKLSSIIEYIFKLEDFDKNVKNKDDETVFFFCLSNNYIFEASNIFYNNESLDYTNSFGNNSLLLLSKSLIETSLQYRIDDENNENNFDRRENLERERNQRNWFGGGVIFGQEQLEEFYRSLVYTTVSKNPDIVNSYNKNGEFVLYYLTSNVALYSFLNIFLEISYTENTPININLKTEQIPFTALYNCVKYDLLNNTELLLEYKANVNIQDDETNNTPLHLAIINKNKDLVRLLVPTTDLNIKNKDGLTILELAIKIKNKDIIKIVKEYTALWKGSSKQDLKLYDIFFENPFNWSCCPVCLQYIERADGCMFVSHDCATTGHYYHKELYEKYKFNYDSLKIEWCSVCGRITELHNHFKLTDSNAKKPSFEDKDEALLRRLGEGDNEVFFDNNNCKGLGGGGTEEKASRLRRLREYSIELQDDVGKKKHVDAIKELIEETWNAPLRREKKKIRKILEEKKFNNDITNLPNVLVKNNNNNNNNSGENVNVEYDGELPKKLDPKTHNCYIGTSENEGKESNPVYEFQHMNRNGIDHSNLLICKDDLEEFIKNQNKQYSGEQFTKCFDISCKAILYPQEIKSIVSNDLYEDYRKKFNKKIRRNMVIGGKHMVIGGKHTTRKRRTKQYGGDIDHVLHKLENITCYQPSLNTKKKKSIFPKRTTLKRINNKI